MSAIRHKQKTTLRTIDTLDGCYSGLAPRGDEIYGLTLRLGHCIDDSNLYIGDDLHNKETGDCFTGRGSLWSCNSRFCAFCVGKLAKLNRSKIRYAIQNAKLLVGEHWYFITLTMPDLALIDLPLPVIAAILQTAWKKFAHYETNENKSQTWFQKHFRGGFKNCEFTYTKYEAYHYHLHGLMIGSYKIQRNDFVEIRREVTKALKSAFKKHGIKWQCKTKDGLAVVNVEKVTSREKVINELAKYVTKSESWSAIPDGQLLEIASMARFWRMFESFGVCRRIVRRMKEKKEKIVSPFAPFICPLLNSLPVAYLDTKNLIPSGFPQNISPKLLKLANPPPKKRKRSWFRRLRDGEITLPDYYNELEKEVSKVVNFRKLQLRRLYPHATFKTVDGWEF